MSPCTFGITEMTEEVLWPKVPDNMLHKMMISMIRYSITHLSGLVSMHVYNLIPEVAECQAKI